MRQLCLLICVWAVLSGCTSEKEVVVIKLGHALDAQHPVHRGMAFLGERLYEKSGGTMRVDLYPSGQLGSERECLELLQIGTLGMTKVSASVLEGFVPAFKLFGLPYLFESDAHRFAVLEGDVGRELLASTEPFWLLGLAYYDAGSRSFYTKRPLSGPEDLRGLKIRTQESATAMRMVNEMGGSATPVAWGELYTALQQGVVDGAENNPPSFFLSRHYEVARYYTLNEHTAVPDVLVVGTTLWNSLTSQQRAWLREAAEESAVYQISLWQEATQDALSALEAAGVVIVRPDRSPYSERTASMLESYRNEPEVYRLIQAIRATQP